MDLMRELMKPSTYEYEFEYEENVSSVRCIQTHISWVFLTGEYCYKVKKPVDFEFLDFSTLERRKFYCNEELRVNRRLCPDIYLGVVPITAGSNGVTAGSNGVRINGNGTVIDYAVKMLELPQDSRMDKLLEDGKVNKGIINKISKILAEFHQSAKTGEGVDKYGSLETIKANWDQNFNQSRNLRTSSGEDVFDLIEGKINGFMQDNSNLFRERIKEGKIRECHGDVHSGNIFIPDDIYIFDAIEFNPAFSCSDTVAEVAFLSMDLDFKGKKELAEFFVESYVDYSRDDVYGLLDFYKCYRAYVRAKVIGFKLLDEGIGEEEKEGASDMYREYFNLAYEYALSLECRH